MFNRPDGPCTNGETMTDLLPPLASLGRLRRDAPKTVAGFRRWRAIIDTDGALPARVKRLFVACAATMKGYRELATRELGEARAAGPTEAERSEEHTSEL